MIFAEISHRGVTALVPCRRINRVTDPHAVYILEDGSLWLGNATHPQQTIIAEVLTQS